MTSSSTGTTNYYDVLGIASTATANEVKSAYREAAKANHPDLGGDPTLMLHINEAYAVLKDATLRSEYDMHLQDQTRREDWSNESEPFVEAETAEQRAAFFERIEQVRFAVQNEYQFLRIATLRSLAIHAVIILLSALFIGIFAPIATPWSNQDIMHILSTVLPPLLLAFFSLYIILTQTAVLLVRPYQYIYECALLDEQISYADEDLIRAILADMIDTKRKKRAEAIRSLIPKAFAAFKRLIKNR